MFGRRKDAAKISDKIPVFHVRYIGSTETFVANGRGCSYAPVQRLWDNSPDEKHLRKVAVYLSQTGIVMKDSEKKDEVIGEFSIENISFCNTDRAVNERIFSWICRSEHENRLDCHAVLCSTKQKAQTMAVVLSRAFQIAYKDWKAHSRHRTTAALPGQQNGAGAGVNGYGGGVGVGGIAGGGGAAAAAAAAASSPRSRRPGVTSGSTSQSPSVSGASPTMTSLGASSGMNGAMASPRGRQHPPPHHTTATSSNSVQPSAPSSRFMHSSILDPDVEDAMRRVGNLNASFDSAESE